MRRWYKTLVTEHAGESLEIDSTFADHARGMGGYSCTGYGSIDEFLSTYFDARLQTYETFLLAHLPAAVRTLSIASGRSVNELRLVARGYDIICSDLEPVCPEETRALCARYRFMRWNALTDPLPDGRFEAVMSL